jgi:hypothetical protein
MIVQNCGPAARALIRLEKIRGDGLFAVQIEEESFEGENALIRDIDARGEGRRKARGFRNG